MSKSISGISEHLNSKDICWDGDMTQWVKYLLSEQKEPYPEKCWVGRHGDLSVILMSGRQRQIPEYTG